MTTPVDDSAAALVDALTAARTLTAAVHAAGTVAQLRQIHERIALVVDELLRIDDEALRLASVLLGRHAWPE